MKGVCSTIFRAENAGSPDPLSMRATEELSEAEPHNCEKYRRQVDLPDHLNLLNTFEISSKIWLISPAPLMFAIRPAFV